MANLDPLGMMKRERPRVLDLEYFGLSNSDLDAEFFTGSRSPAVPHRMRLRDIIAQLRQIYCGSIGAEFAHVSNTEERLWLQEQFQTGRLQQRFAPAIALTQHPCDRRSFLQYVLPAAVGLVKEQC